MKRLKIGLDRLKPSDLLAKAIDVETKLTGNPVFSNPVPALADLAAASTELEIRITASNMGDRSAIARRKEQEKEVRYILRKLGSYVQLTSENDSDILSSGFELSKTPVPLTSLSRPAALKAMRSDMEGRVNLTWAVVRGSNQYVVEVSSQDPINQTADWIHTAYTSRSNHQIDNLQPGKYYWFRVRALGASGMSPYSDPAMVMAA
ncbi:fibronectin type III domain-containing protein [Cryomorpha ignava]|uniref:Fibronectin type III domain-containing protein n=1 Tax=Cryomorpha ignava TaxID=101383 RepID=A0A7K3WRD4_9FLAO|nr:fibronectin type III domain-containing protein [Cryomorpha ignava]NEN23402.1 fibronectin type III domain-containing protein [Cryomorpha ignava]